MKRILLLWISCMTVSMVAQTDSAGIKLRAFVSNIQAFNYIYPQEKVYLHFDNTGYFLDETIWFKAYVVGAEALTINPLSRVLHVELLTQEGVCVDSKILKIENGQAHGEFALNKDWRAGYYEVRAYTRMMLNYGEEILFSRVFPVWKAPEEEGDYSEKDMTEPYSSDLENIRKKAEKTDAVHLDFYPEGGNLIAGLRNRVAFRATGKSGENIDVSGVVLTADKTEIASFST